MSDYVPPIQDDVIDPIEQQPVQIEAPPSAVEMHRMGHEFDAAAAAEWAQDAERVADRAHARAADADATFEAARRLRQQESHLAADAAESASHPITPHDDPHALDDAERFRNRADDELNRFSHQTHSLSLDDMAREHLPAFGVQEEAIVHDALVQNTAFHLDPALAAALHQGVAPAHGPAILSPGLPHTVGPLHPYPGKPGRGR